MNDDNPKKRKKLAPEEPLVTLVMTLMWSSMRDQLLLRWEASLSVGSSGILGLEDDGGSGLSYCIGLVNGWHESVYGK